MNLQRSLDQVRQYIDSGDIDAAELLTEKLQKKRRKHLDLVFLRGCIRFKKADFQEAIRLMKLVLDRDPAYIGARLNLGVILNEAGESEEACGHIEEVLRQQPANVIALYNLANAYQKLGRLYEAKNKYLKTIEIQPDYVPVYNNLAFVCYELGDKHDALRYFKKAVDLEHSDRAYVNLLTLLRREKSPQAYRHALEAIELRDGTNSLVYAHTILWEACRWDIADTLVDRVVSLCAGDEVRTGVLQDVLLTLNCSPLFDRTQVYEIHRNWARKACVGRVPYSEYENARLFDKKLRIGYLSGDFYHHSVGRFIHHVIANHDASRFEIICYSRGKVSDGLTQSVRKHAHNFVDVKGASAEELAARIHRDGIHILVDIAGHTANTGVDALCYKPAPIQMTYLGYPNTTGLSTVDYRITDSYADSDSDAYYSEKLLKLPESFLCFGEFEEKQLDPTPPANSVGYVTFGSFNNNRKITPDVVRVWSEILSATSGSKLLLKCGKFAIEEIKENVTRTFEDHGVARDRLILLSHVKDTSSHLDCYRRIDIALDTFPYNGTTTTCEALWMGVPVVTLVGSAHAQRVSYSILNNCGVTETIASDEGGYKRIAIALASDMDWLADIRRRCAESIRGSILCNPASFTRQLESGYIKAWAEKGVDLPNVTATAISPGIDSNAMMGAEADGCLISEAKTAISLCNWDAAKTRLTQHLSLHPDDPEADFLLGAVLYRQQDYQGALDSLNRAREASPNNTGVLLNLGATYQEMKRYSEAVDCYERLLSLEPRHAIALNNMGNISRMRGDFDKACQYLRRSIQIDECYWPANVNLGCALASLGKDDEARNCFENAFDLEKNPRTYAAMLMSLRKSGDYTKAYEIARDVEQVPSPGVALLPAYNIFSAVCDWNRRDKIQKKIMAVLREERLENPILQSFLLATNYNNCFTPEEVFEVHRMWGQREEAQYIPYDSYALADRETGKIRVGLLSPDFRRHSVGLFIRNVIACHDRLQFEIYCYSSSEIEDNVTQEIRAGADVFRVVRAMDGESLARCIHDDGVGILIDLAGHTTDSRLGVLCYRPAPIQISFLGYPNTTGLDCVDYRISDPYADQECGGDTLYSEKLARMPRSFLCFGKLIDVDRIEEAPVLHIGRVTFGSFNNLNKLTGQMVDAWSQILAKVDGSRLLIKAECGAIACVRENLLSEFEKNGISPDRVELRGFSDSVEEHLALYNTVDIALDTAPYNGTTTTCEALWMGVPVVSFVGSRHVQRVGYSILKNIGMEETICHSLDEYIETAVALATDPMRLSILRKRVAKSVRESILCDPVAYMRDLEGLLGELWSDYRGSSRGPQAWGDVVESTDSIPSNDQDSVAQTEIALDYEPGIWPLLIQRRHYAVQLSGRWLRFMEENKDNDRWKIHQIALDRFALANSSSQNNEQRTHQLRSAYGALFRLVDIGGNLANLQSLARIATVLGERETALHALYYVASCIERDQAISCDEPFLVACQRYEEIDPKDNIDAWIYSSVLEQIEQLERELSITDPDQSLDRLMKLRLMGFLSEERSKQWETEIRATGLGRAMPDAPPVQTPEKGSVRRLHIGGKQEHPEWEIFNAIPASWVDHVGNAKDLSRFDDHTFDEIYGSHVLEHFDYVKELKAVLSEWYRVLKPGGTLYISVPDLDKLAELLLMKDRLNVEQRFLVMRMMFGGEVDEYDYHKVGLNREFLEQYLVDAGFRDPLVVDSFGLFDDTSDYRPFGYPISLNMIAHK